MTRRLLVAAAILATAALPTSVSVAGEFTVAACGDAPGYVNNAWASSNTDSVTMMTSSDCGADHDQAGLYVGDKLAAGPPNAGVGDEAWWTFTAPTGTSIRELSANRWGHAMWDDHWDPEIRVDNSTIPLDTCSFTSGNDECSFGLRGGEREVYSGLGSASSLQVGARCNPQGSFVSCQRGVNIHSLDVALYGAEVTLDDIEDPTPTGLSAPSLADGKWHRASESGQISLVAADNTGIRQREIRLAGVPLVTETAPTPGEKADGCGALNKGLAYTFTRPCAGDRGLNGERATTVSLATAPEGTLPLEAVVTDTGGRTATSDPVTVMVDRTVPEAPVVSGSGDDWGQIPDREASWTVEAASDSAPIARVDVEVCSPDDVCELLDKGSASFGAALEHRLIDLPDGETTVRVRHTDAAGNVGAWSPPARFRRDSTAPLIDIVAPPATAPAGTYLRFAVTASDAHSGVGSILREVQIDGGPWLPITLDELAVAGSTYRFRATATDAAGNRAQRVTGTTTVPAPLRPAPTVTPLPTPAPTATGGAVATPSPAPTVTPTPAPKRSSRVTITRATWRGGRVTVSGTRTRAASGRVRLTLAGVSGRQRWVLLKRLPVARGVWRGTFRLGATTRRARSVRVTVVYGGDSRFVPARRVTRTLRRR